MDRDLELAEARVRKARRLATRLLAVALGLVLVIGGFELYLRSVIAGGASDPGTRPPARHVLCDCPWVYGLNPEHPEVSSQGLRDREFAIPKPAGTYRVLVVGDSVPYGPFVPAEQTFPKALERLFAAENRPVEVINAGISGYTTYNETEWYIDRGKTYDADVVLLSLCLNDVVDPELHWDALGRSVGHVPIASLPDVTYHRTVIMPLLERYRAQREGLLVKRWLNHKFYRSWSSRRFERGAYEKTPDGRRPIFLTGEDTMPIQVLLDANTPQCQWLFWQLERLRGAVEAHGARLIIVIPPLAYQLDEGYPYWPQETLIPEFEKLGIETFDLYPALAKHPKPDVFLLEGSGFLDMWHFTPLGHEVAAQAIFEHLLGR